MAVERLRFLVTAKTYPVPSARYLETVCTAGIRADGRWVRLYPVPFRYLPRRQQYRLYDWVEVEAEKRPPGKDPRPESYQPVGDPTVVGHVSTERNWAERKCIILPHASRSVEELQERYGSCRQSLGIVRPAQIAAVCVEQQAAKWPPRRRAAMEQGRLLGPQPKRLEFPGHRFSYRFRCEDSRCRGHSMQIMDWGLAVLYLRTREQEGEEAAVAKTRRKCEWLASPEHDTWLFLGTIHPYRQFAIIGVFYPRTERKGAQPSLCLG